ncbi:APC family permease [Actinomadura sp. 9N407]|uniref:APC family permease n=1 Tax=Actinomadura sp. 9N407 TaxID=3375154 RepID=UPI0037A2379A
MTERVDPYAQSHALPPDAPPDHLRKGTLKTVHVVGLVIAAAAPLSVVTALVPLAILLGNGVGTPGAVFLVAIVLALFSIGFVRVVPHIQNAGAFYAYISQSLGKPVGLASAYVLVLAYLALGGSVAAGFGYFGADLIERLIGIDVHWLVISILGAFLASVLAVLGIDLSARVVVVILLLEGLIVAVVNIAIVVQAGLGAFSLDAISPSHVFSGSPGVAVVYVFTFFLGFEATAIYSEETANPRRTVPRATYYVIAIIALFDGLTAWCLIAGAGFDKAVGLVAQEPGAFMFTLTEQYVGSAWADLVSIMVVVSIFAGILAFQNAAARYFFALARDGVLPRVLTTTYRRTGTPAAGLVLTGLIFGFTCVAYGAAGLDPLLDLSTSLIGLGALGLLAMLTLTSLSVAIFFYRQGQITVAHVGIPVLAALLLGACTAAVLHNYSALSGSNSWVINGMPLIFLPVALVGVGVALWLRGRDRQRYDVMGSSRV